jgi:hypothetical protein
MTKNSLVSTRLSSNDIPSRLAQIFSASLHFYCEHNSPLESTYLTNLNTIVGLGFTAAIMAGDGFPFIRSPHLTTFLSNIPFKKEASDIPALSLAVANMVERAVCFFRQIHHADHYRSFIETVKKTVMQVAVHEFDKAEEAERLLRVLFGK